MLVAGPRAQEAGELDLLLDRLGRYLIAYERELTTVVADERYDQMEVLTGRRAVAPVSRMRKLESEVAFLRLPDGSIWFGLRDVRKVDGKSVVANQQRVQELLERLDPKMMEEAAKIVAASAQHNLGGMRTINMPTTPLEVLHPHHHVQFIFKVGGTERIDGTKTTKLEFEEFDEPTIITGTDGGPLFIKGTAWIEPENGRLWRVQLTVNVKLGDRIMRSFENRMRVEFRPHAVLKIMVPQEMQEYFWVPGGRGEGRARYSNFRQFGTSARILPQ